MAELQNLLIGPAWTYGAAPKPDMTVKKGSASYLEYSPQQQAQLGVTATGAQSLQNLQVGEVAVPILISFGSSAASIIGLAVGAEVAKDILVKMDPSLKKELHQLQNLKQGCPECLEPGFPFNTLQNLQVGVGKPPGFPYNGLI